MSSTENHLKFMKSPQIFHAQAFQLKNFFLSFLSLLSSIIPLVESLGLKYVKFHVMFRRRKYLLLVHESLHHLSPYTGNSQESGKNAEDW
ncbi:hypothetical protein CEXT_515361 [Caerostris extrusa]|uniref:Uncharacterized protein n=1 Tax=Caerostris extrusa TaxID=172846 RepID=A0AAV4QVV4_CAEEX|nr:hypothetical protein CEXT_515361 [Caerostris extrusa]